MTQQEFTAFYPQFANFTPAVVMTTYIDQANARFESFGSDAEEARRLYAAHKLTLYARTFLPDGLTPSKSAIATAGQTLQQVSSKKVGEVTVSYSSIAGSGSSFSTGFADLTQSQYGIQLLSLLRIYGRSVYVP